MNNKIGNNLPDEAEIDISIRLLTLYDTLKWMGKFHTQKEFCALLGISESFFTEIKKGRSGINPDKLQNMSEDLSEYRDWILTGKNSPFADGRLPFLGGEGPIPRPKPNQIMRTKSGLVVVPEKLWDSIKTALDFYEDLDRQGKINPEQDEISLENRYLSIIESQQRTIENLSKK